MKRNSLLPYALIGVVLVMVVLLFVSSQASNFTANTGGNDSSKSASSLPQPPPTCHYCPAHLLNASSAEIGQFAVQYAVGMHETSGDQPQVLLSRRVTPEDYPTLGLGCPPSQVTFEQPPLALVILKGDLHPDIAGMSVGRLDAKYIAYIFDLWADEDTSEMWSADGGMFRKALNDPTLPDESSSMPMACPTPLPYKITQHYGEAAPPVSTSGIPERPVGPSPTVMPSAFPEPSQSIPQPKPTSGP